MAVIGVNVIEVEGDSLADFVAAPIARPAFLIRSERGPVDTPVRLRGVSEYRRWFGGHVENLFGSHVAQGVIDNGGSEMLCVRIVGAGAVASSATLNDRAAAGTLLMQAGTHGAQDPGEWGDSLTVSVEENPRARSAIVAQVTSTNAEPFALAAGNQLDVTVNGATVVSVTFNAADFADITAASAEEVVTVIQAASTQLNAAVTSTGNIVLSGTLPSAGSRLEIAGGAVAALGYVALNDNSDEGLNGAAEVVVQAIAGFAVNQAVRVMTRGHAVGASLAAPVAIIDGATFDVSVDGGPNETIQFTSGGAIADLANATAPEIVAAINMQAQGFDVALDSQSQIVIRSNTFGPGSSIAIAAGAPDDAAAPIGILAAVPVGGTEAIQTVAGIGEQARIVRLDAALPAVTTPTGVARIDSAEFDLVVHRGGTEVERHSGLSMETGTDFYAVAVVNDEQSGSSFVRLTDLGSGSGPGMNVPAPISEVALVGGNDGAAPLDNDYIGDAATRTGLHALDTEGFELLAFSDTTAPAVFQAALNFAEAQGTVMCIGTGALGMDAQAIGDYAAQFRARNAYGTMIWPRGMVANPLDTDGSAPMLTVPLVGHYAGMLAKVGRERGSWISPAGDKARIRVLGLETSVTDATHTDLAENRGVSVIRAIPGSGIIADSARTLATDNTKRYVSTRLFLNFIKATLLTNMDIFLQEPIDERLCNRVSDAIRAFFLGLWQNGAFGSGAADESFRIDCGPAQNTPAQIAQGIFNVEVLYRALSPAEFIIVRVSQLRAETAVTES